MKRNSDTRLAPPLARRQASAQTQAAPDTLPTKWQRRAQSFRNHPFVTCVETVGLLALIVAAFLFFVDLEERQDERITRAWQLVTTVAPGNGGKRQALQYLNRSSLCFWLWFDGEPYRRCWKYQSPLDSIDLSALRHGGQVHLAGLHLPKARLIDAKLSGAELIVSNLSGAAIHRADFSGSSLIGVDLSNALGESAIFSGASLREATLTNASLVAAKFVGANLRSADFEGANLRLGDFTGANMSGANLNGTNLERANLSGVTFGDKFWQFHRVDGEHQRRVRLPPEKLDHETKLTGIWAWADRPPKNMPRQVATAITYRDPSQREEGK